MKNKRILIIFMIFILVMGSFVFVSSQKKEKTKVEEITPEEEISEQQERNTIVKLYFRNKENGELTIEERKIDVKKLTDNPYEELINMLIEGPKNGNLEKLIPEETKINNIKIIGNIVYVDLSREFIENQIEGIENESKTIYSIVNTLTELNEVEFVKILIDGEENMEFKDGCMNFKENFERND